MEMAKFDLDQTQATVILQSLAHYLSLDITRARNNVLLFRRVAEQAPLVDIVAYYCQIDDGEGAVYFARNSFEAALCHADRLSGDVANTYALPLGFGPVDGSTCGPALDRCEALFNPTMVENSIKNAREEVRVQQKYRNGGDDHEDQELMRVFPVPKKPGSEMN